MYQGQQLQKQLDELRKLFVNSEKIKLESPDLEDRINKSLIETIKFLHQISQEEQSTSKTKVALYCWQVCNGYMIALAAQKMPIYQFLEGNLVEQFANAYVDSIDKCSDNSFKFMLIFQHNWLHQKQEGAVIRVLKLVLKTHFKRSSEAKKVSQSEQSVLVNQLQWVGHLFVVLSEKVFVEDRHFLRELDSLQKKTVKETQRTLYRGLHLINNFYAVMLSNRVTTEMIKGYPCPFEQMRGMYQSPVKNTVMFALTMQDYKDLLSILEDRHQTFKKEIKETVQFSKKGSIQSSQCSQTMVEIIGIFNSVLFLGGYNKPLQEVFRLKEALMILQFLQISYLLYVFARQRTKKIEIKKLPESKFYELIGLDEPQFPEQSQRMLGEIGQQFLEEGQLTCVVRLFANLSHINPSIESMFQQHIKYVYIILSLTHDYENQATMREWAIIFTRNITESSPSLAEKISRIQTQVRGQPY